MPESVTAELPANETTQIQAEIRASIAEMQRANERIKKDQDEIQRLKRKTRATLAELREAI